MEHCYTVWLQILQNTVPVQTMQLWIFQNTENCSSAKHWTLILCNYGYSRTLKTVPVQKAKTKETNKQLILSNHRYFRTLKTVPVQNIDELCTYRYSKHWTLYRYRTLINCSEHWTLCQYAALIFTNTDNWCHNWTPLNCADMDMLINTMQFCDCGYS